MVTTITEVLNIWNEMGVFSYVIPFVLIFAVVFAILDKTKMLSSEGDKAGNKDSNRPIIGIIAASVALLSLQFDFVSEFFAVIFPRFGVGLSLFLVILIFLGFFFNPENNNGKWSGKVAWVGWVVGIGVFIWSLSAWNRLDDYSGFGGWFSNNFWAVLVLGIIIAIIAIVVNSNKDG